MWPGGRLYCDTQRGVCKLSLTVDVIVCAFCLVSQLGNSINLWTIYGRVIKLLEANILAELFLTIAKIERISSHVQHNRTVKL